MKKETINLNDPAVPKQFSVVGVIRQAGDKNSAKTEDGKIVRREEKLYMGEYGLVMCAPYMMHFIFENKSNKIGAWSPVCTCGAPAGVVGANAYADDASPTTSMDSTNAGQMIVCLSHAQTGKHADGSSE